MPEKDAANVTPSGPAGAPDKGLTPTMKRTLLAVGAVTLVGAVASIWLLLASGDAPTASEENTAGPSATATPGPVPGATPAEGSEVQSPLPEQTDPGRLPPLPEPTPRVTAPLPASASANGELVAGFPSTLMPVAPDSDVVSSSIATEGDTMQVTLMARTDASKESVIETYRTAWSELGLKITDAESAISAIEAFSSITLSFTPESGTGTVYALYGVFRTG